MRFPTLTALALPLLALWAHLASAGTPRAFQAQEELDPESWEEVMTHVFDEGMVRPAEGQGATGTEALQVEIGKVRGTLLVDRRHGDQISVFLGWSIPEKYAEDAHEDLRVRFRAGDGEAYVTELFAGGAYGLQFASPADVELAKLEGFSLLVRKKARWLKGK